MHVLLSGNRKFLFVVDKSCNSENFGGNYGSSSAEHELRGLKTFLAKESLLCTPSVHNIRCFRFVKQMYLDKF
jgi:hypothetical protein